MEPKYIREVSPDEFEGIIGSSLREALYELHVLSHERERKLILRANGSVHTAEPDK